MILTGRGYGLVWVWELFGFWVWGVNQTHYFATRSALRGPNPPHDAKRSALRGPQAPPTGRCFAPFPKRSDLLFSRAKKVSKNLRQTGAPAFEAFMEKLRRLNACRPPVLQMQSVGQAIQTRPGWPSAAPGLRQDRCTGHCAWLFAFGS